MVTTTLRRVIQIVLVAGVSSGCSDSRVNSTTAGSGGGGNDAGEALDAHDVDTDAQSECAFTPCGGDLVGDWTIRRACLASVYVRDCPTAELLPKDVVVSGRVSFEADGGLTFDISSTGTWEGLVPASCVEGTDCETIAQTLYQVNAPPASCTSEASGGCNCSSPATPKQVAMVPYRVSGNTAAFMSYCVRGDTMMLQNESGTVFVAER